MSTNWGQSQPAPLALWSLIHSRFPETRMLGIYNPDHDDHGEGRALDVGLLVGRPAEAQVAWGLITDVLLPNQAEIDWSYFIWDQWMWYPDARGKQRGGFKGDHTNHIHISWSREASQRKSFPQTASALDALARKIGGGVEDEATQASYYRPYSR